MALDIETLKTHLWDDSIANGQTPDPNFYQTLGDRFKVYAEGGTMTPPAVLPSGDVNELYNAFSSSDIAGMVAGFKAYFDSWTTPDTPQTCSAITSVTVDTVGFESAVLAGLNALASSVAALTEFSDVPFNTFWDAVDAGVKTITWTVVEADGSPCSSTYPVSIS